MDARKRPVIIWGAGRIGRGFAAEVFRGHPLALADIDRALIDGLRGAGGYTIFGADARGEYECRIEGYQALHTDDRAGIEGWLLRDQPIVVVCVFADKLPQAAGMLAPYIRARAREMPGNPMDFIMAVNMLHPERAFRTALETPLANDPEALTYLKDKVGTAASTFMCISPDAPAACLAKDPLCTYNNHYREQVVDALSLRGAHPDGLPMLRLTRNIAAEETRKLYTLNMAHAATSYLCVGKPHGFMLGAVSDPDVRPLIERALDESAIGLRGEFGSTDAEMTAWNRRIIGLLENPHIGDDLPRLGADTRRKLFHDDRLAGPALLCLKHGGAPTVLARAIRSGLDFEHDDPGTRWVRDIVKTEGLAAALRKVCGLSPMEPLFSMILNA